MTLLSLVLSSLAFSALAVFCALVLPWPPRLGPWALFLLFAALAILDLAALVVSVLGSVSL